MEAMPELKSPGMWKNLLVKQAFDSLSEQSVIDQQPKAYQAIA